MITDREIFAIGYVVGLFTGGCFSAMFVLKYIANKKINLYENYIVKLIKIERSKIKKLEKIIKKRSK